MRPESSVTEDQLIAGHAYQEDFEWVQSLLILANTCLLCLWSPRRLSLMLIGHQSSAELGVQRCSGYIVATVHASLVAERPVETHSTHPCWRSHCHSRLTGPRCWHIAPGNFNGTLGWREIGVLGSSSYAGRCWWPCWCSSQRLEAAERSWQIMVYRWSFWNRLRLRLFEFAGYASGCCLRWLSRVGLFIVCCLSWILMSLWSLGFCVCQSLGGLVDVWRLQAQW